MAKVKERVLVCDCEGSMSLDIKALSNTLDEHDILSHTHLCRSQIDALSKAAAGGAP